MNLPNEITKLRRELELLKKTQVVISDTEPKEAKSKTIWRDGETTKIQNSSGEWVNISGGIILDFSTTVLFSSSSYNNVSWSAWVINVWKENWSVVSSISAWGITMSGNTFFYWSPSIPTAIQTTTSASTAIMNGGIIIAVGIPNSDATAAKAWIKTFGNNQNDLITADQIVANTITANKLASQLIYAGSLIINPGGLIRWGQTAFNTGNGFFLGYSWTAYKFSIGQSTWNYLSYDGTNMVMNGWTIQTASGTWQRIVIDSSLMKVYDSSNVLRTQLISGGIRIAESTWIYSSDISASVYDNGAGTIWPSIQISDTSWSNRVWLRTAFIYGTSASTSLDLYLRGWTISFRGINNSVGAGVQLSSPDNDTLTISWSKISLWGLMLEKSGSDLYWNGVKIN